MSKLNPEPRVNGATLAQHKGQNVRLTAKVLEISNDRATVEASDGVKIAVLMSPDMHMSDQYVEIIGLVKDDQTLKGAISINLGSNLDMKAVNEVVKFGHSSVGEDVLY